MRRGRATALDRIFASAPVNRQAALVVARGGEHFEGKYTSSRDTWTAPKPVFPFPGPRQEDLTGRLYGRMTVIGYLGNDNSKAQARWLVRCVCGNYEKRTTRAVRNPANVGDRCQPCSYLRYIQRRAVFDRTGQWAELRHD